MKYSIVVAVFADNGITEAEYIIHPPIDGLSENFEIFQRTQAEPNGVFLTSYKHSEQVFNYINQKIKILVK